jgi:hypothetical protein
MSKPSDMMRSSTARLALTGSFCSMTIAPRNGGSKVSMPPLHPACAHGAPVVGGLEFFPLELAGVAGFLAAVALDQHDRQVAHFAQVARHGGGRGLGRVEAFVVLAAQQLPEELDQRGLAGAGQPVHFEEREALHFGADLLGKQRSEEEAQAHQPLAP